MGEVNYRKLESILEKFNSTVEEISNLIIEELRKNSLTYKDLDKKINIFQKAVEFSSEIGKYDYLFKRIRQLVEQEKNDLPLTNRSTSEL